MLLPALYPLILNGKSLFDPIFKPAERDDKVILVSAPSEDQNQDDPASSEPFVVFDLNLSNSDEVWWCY